MTITEKAAYIRGLVEGLDIDKDTKENKIIAAIVDIIDDMALTIADLEDTTAELYDYVEELDMDLGTVEEDLYGEDEEDEDGCNCGCDGVHYKTECPNCGEEIILDEDMLNEGSFECPHCGEEIDFSEDDECDCETDGCDCGHKH
jgi:DNA-directed RNA polymerase subunit RPC12/RpoP